MKFCHITQTNLKPVNGETGSAHLSKTWIRFYTDFAKSIDSDNNFITRNLSYFLDIEFAGHRFAWVYISKDSIVSDKWNLMSSSLWRWHSFSTFTCTLMHHDFIILCISIYYLVPIPIATYPLHNIIMTYIYMQNTFNKVRQSCELLCIINIRINFWLLYNFLI